jgi:hypothetical protein
MLSLLERKEHVRSRGPRLTARRALRFSTGDGRRRIVSKYNAIIFVNSFGRKPGGGKFEAFNRVETGSPDESKASKEQA